MRRVTSTASAGRWEKALADLIASLRAANQAVTAEEHDQLHAMLEALHLPTERLHHLDMRG